MHAILNLLSSDLPSGTAKQIHYLSEALQPGGFLVHKCSLEHENEHQLRIAGLLPNIEFCRHGSYLDPTIYFRIAGLIRKYRPKIIHLWGHRAPLLLPKFLQRTSHTPLFRSIRSIADLHSPVSLQCNQHLVTNAEYLARGIQKRKLLVDTIHNGVPLENSATVCSLHHELQLPPGCQFIATVGDLRSHKRWKDLIWAFDLLHVIHPHVHLLIIGQGEQRRAIESFANSASCSKNVHLMGHREDIIGLVQQANCFWVASQNEGSSNALLEAMCAQIPVVAFDDDAHRELLENGKWGQLVPVGDCAELARKTNVLLLDPSPAQQRAIDAQHFVRQRFDIAQMASRYRELYCRALNQRVRVA